MHYATKEQVEKCNCEGCRSIRARREQRHLKAQREAHKDKLNEQTMEHQRLEVKEAKNGKLK